MARSSDEPEGPADQGEGEPGEHGRITDPVAVAVLFIMFGLGLALMAWTTGPRP